MHANSKRIKIEFQDSSGKNIKIEFNGNTTGQEIQRIYDFLCDSPVLPNDLGINVEERDTKFQKFSDIIIKHFPIGEFTSSDALLITQEVLGEQIKHALISTYLMRLVDRSQLNRKWSSVGWVYSLIKKTIIQQ
jgi:hypothetical protein